MVVKVVRQRRSRRANKVGGKGGKNKPVEEECLEEYSTEEEECDEFTKEKAVKVATVARCKCGGNQQGFQLKS